jgi:RND family efflux transporter MFP subunit
MKSAFTLGGPRRNVATWVVRALLLLILAWCSSAGSLAWAHGGEDHGEAETPATASAVAASSPSGETTLGLRLADLSQSAAGTEAPLFGAQVRGLLKRADTGATLARVSAHAGGEPGSYDVHFNGDNATFAFPGAGRYELELNIRPPRGEAIDATVPFSLAPASPASAESPAPLWRRAWPLGLAFLALAALAATLWRRRRMPPRSGPTPFDAGATTALLLLAIGCGPAAQLWAHGGEDHSEEDEAVAAVAAPIPSGALASEATTTMTAGNIRITVVARTSASAPQVLAPGEVALSRQTSELLDIRTAPVQVARLSTGVDFSGRIAPDPSGTVRVASLVPGRVTRLVVGQGDAVRRGQVLAVVESRAVGEAQLAYQQASTRLASARANFDVVVRQARAGVFSRAPLEAAQRVQAEASGEVRQGQASVRQAEGALANALRVARVGGFASPALEAARNAQAQTREEVRSAQAALDGARAAIQSAQAELARRQQLAASGSYSSRPVEEARRLLVAAQSARAAAGSEVSTTRANLNRARSLAAEGLVSQRDLEAAQQAFDTAQARQQTAEADERAAQSELSRQQQLGRGNVAGAAEVQAARALLAQAQADVRTREAQVQRAQTQAQVAGVALSRERAVFGQNLANRREIEAARANVQSARAGLYKAQRSLEISNATLAREREVFRRRLNNLAPVQQARSGLVQAQADLDAARSTLGLLKSAPGQGVSVPVRAPIDGVVQAREVAVGELVQADAPLLTLVNLSNVAIEAALFEADLAQVSLGAPVRVTTPSAPGRAFEGRVSFIGSQVDSQTRTVTARALIANPRAANGAPLLRAGTFARGRIQTGVGRPSVTVPASAVLDDGAARVVFVARGGKYLRREVVLGNESAGRVEVMSGLKPGESVVTEGAAALRAQAARS